MAQAKTNKQRKPINGANVGYEAELWQMEDALRGSMDAVQNKHNPRPHLRHAASNRASALSSLYSRFVRADQRIGSQTPHPHCGRRHAASKFISGELLIMNRDLHVGILA
jgi:hypothetical protein